MPELLFDFLSREKIKEPHIIGRGVLPIKGQMVIGGAPKRNKSFVAINIGLSLANGEPIFAARFPSGCPVLPITRSYRTLYIEQEIGEEGLDDRLRKIPGVINSTAPFYITSRDLSKRMDTETGKAAIENEIESCRAEILILDPLKAFHSYDENSSQMMGHLMNIGVSWIEKYGLSIIYIHHAGHHNPEFPRQGGELLRGSTAIYAAADTIMIVKARSELSAAEPLLELDYELRRGEPILPHYVKRLRSGKIKFLGEGRIWDKNEQEEPSIPEPRLKPSL